jgi:hypothetical protein
MKIKRYDWDPYDGMVEQFVGGDYVSFTDFDAMRAEARKLVERAYDVIGGNWPEADKFLKRAAE